MSAFVANLKVDAGEDMGKRAKQTHAFFRTFMPKIDPKVCLHVTNQITFNPVVMFGDAKTTAGGEAIKYYSTYRVFLTGKAKMSLLP